MATYTKRKNGDGSTSIVAQVRVRPFKPVAKSFEKQAEAKDWAEALERELRGQSRRGGLSEDLTKLTLKDLVDAYLEDPETRSRASYEDKSDRLAWWVNHAGGVKVLAFNVVKLRKARDVLRPGRAPATVNRHLSELRSCWNWGRSAGLVPADHLWPTRLMLREDNERQRYLTDAELARLLTAARSHSPTLQAAIVVSLACGLRQGELLRLTWADVDLQTQRARILKTKTDRPRGVYLPMAAVDALRALKRGRIVGTQAVFLAADGTPLDKTRLRERWLKIRTAAKLKDFRWHDLRHSCASFLAQQGASLLEIGSVLGHRSAAITRRYAHLVEGAPVRGHAELDEKLQR